MIQFQTDEKKKKRSKHINCDKIPLVFEKNTSNSRKFHLADEALDKDLKITELQSGLD